MKLLLLSWKRSNWFNIRLNWSQDEREQRIIGVGHRSLRDTFNGRLETEFKHFLLLITLQRLVDWFHCIIDQFLEELSLVHLFEGLSLTENVQGSACNVGLKSQVFICKELIRLINQTNEKWKNQRVIVSYSVDWVSLDFRVAAVDLPVFKLSLSDWISKKDNVTITYLWSAWFCFFFFVYLFDLNPFSLS